MQVLAKRTLQAFRVKHPRAESSLRAWHLQPSAAGWAGPADIRRQFGSADFVADNRVIFNIAGNRYRLVVHVDYAYHRVLIKLVGTHADYDRINPETVG